MTLTTLISQNRKHYRRFYRLVAIAVIIMTAVLTGSLLLGDSVRDTLVQRVSERLGKTETIIASGTGFMDEALMKHPLMDHAKCYLMMDGFVSIDDRLLPVYVWGTDADSLDYGKAIVNEPLLLKLGGKEDIVLHLPSHNMVPAGSLFVTKSYATQMRLHVSGVRRKEEGGNLLLKNEQTLPLNIFVNRTQLAEKISLEGKINLVLSDDIIEEKQLTACWTPKISGINMTDSSLTYDGIFIPHEVVEKCKVGINSPTLYFSYLVNDLVHGIDTVPYSFVTAVNEWQGEPLDGNDIILSDYAANRLHVHEGDSIRMSYFMAKHLKTLDTNERTLKVKQIVPLSRFMRDSLLIADFPGLSHVEKCTDWDSDLPIKMDRVHKEDEDFWYAYRQTPKAVVSYQAVSTDWSNAFGGATALRFSSRPDIRFSPGDAGVLLYHPRAQGLSAAAGGVDFAGLFLSLGFFIILAAILLMKNPLLEMFTLRSDELQLYEQLGFKDADIKKSIFRESFSVMLFASPWGVIAGLAYSALTLWLLGNVWSGATHTEGFALHIHPLTLVIGWLTGMVICAVTLWIVVRNVMKHGKEKHDAAVQKNRYDGLVFTLLLTMTAILIAVNFIIFHSIPLFIVCGLLWILTWSVFLRAWVSRQFAAACSKEASIVSRNQLTWMSVFASMRQHLLAYWTLSLGIFTVFAVGLNRPDFSKAWQASGGYQLYVDSRVPIQYDMNNRAVRNKLSLKTLPDSTSFLGFLRHTQDEASCLNLNKVSVPTVLGVDLDEMKTFGLIPTQTHSTASIYIDEEALIWSLMKSVGDTILYQDDRGEDVSVVIAGTYPTGLFHGYAIMSSEDFRRLWPKESGIEVMLVKSAHPDEASRILSTAMSEYGLTIQTAKERLQMFFEVTETYLLIFMTLGGLGLLLGLFSLIVIVRKNLTAQTTAIRQYCALGFTKNLIGRLLIRENLIVPVFSIFAGATGAVISISANMGGAGLVTILVSLVVLIVICILLLYGIKNMVMQSINNQNQLQI